MLRFLVLAAACVGVSLGAPPTRTVPLLSMQPAFCGGSFPNYLWLATAQLACLGMSDGCNSAGCGVLTINGQALNVTAIGTNGGIDGCGTCEGCDVAFISFDTNVPGSANAIEGQNASLTYQPAAAPGSTRDLPDCPPIPGPWGAVTDKQLEPACSIYERQGSLDATTADECLSQVQARDDLNYALWHGTCDVCTIRWRGAATSWQYSDSPGAKSYTGYVTLAPPAPSGACDSCPPSPPSPLVASLANDRIKASFNLWGLDSIASLASAHNVSFGNDGFAIGLDGQACTCSASLPQPTTQQADSSAVSFIFSSLSQKLKINVTYALLTGAAFVSKTIVLTDTSETPLTRVVNSVTALDGAALAVNGTTSADSRTSKNVLFLRWADPQRATHKFGAFLTAQNSFVDSPSLSWQPDRNWTTMDAQGTPASRVLDAAIIGLYDGALTGQLELAEAAAVTEAVQEYLVAPAEPNVTVKINIAWCEDDYQLDISLPEDREEYKRIIDRAADFGITHILFAPRNSDVSSRDNNTDPWGWEQTLWFGMGQKLRMGQWVPGDPLPASLQEMLDYFKLRGVKPVAYVYPILAFLAGTLPGGGSPPWIVEGSYMTSMLGSGSLPLRSNLANEEFIAWLPETMLKFADATGAGGFSFDLTYWEEALPVASEYAQWAGWRNILAQLHTNKDGKGCAGSRCIVDNRQANHGWGAWMWAQGGTYAEPLMSDEQPASWTFYEADLHTDRLAGNKQRAVAKGYRDAYCPNEVLPGFAFHQTDREPSQLQNEDCSAGRCSNHSRRRDFDLLGYRYSLLSSIGTGGLNNVMNMLPARDTQEFSLFPQEDINFVRDWLTWADQHVALQKLTRPVPSLATPAQGQVDGTIMLESDNTGAMFLFNPTMREMNVSLPLSGDVNASLGFACLASTAPVLVRLLASSERTAVAYAREVLGCGDKLSVTLPATSAVVLGFEQWRDPSAPLVLGSVYSKAVVDSSASSLNVSGVLGESGTPTSLLIVLPKGTVEVKHVMVNGAVVTSFSKDTFRGLPAVVVQGSWTGVRFGRAHEIRDISLSDGGKWAGSFSVSQGAMDQLNGRNASYPIKYNLDTEDTDDANVPWLAPGRLLIFVKYAQPIDDTLNITASIDGQPLLVRKAYNTIVRNTGRFIGHWADATTLVSPGKQQTLTLQLPDTPIMLDGVFFDNVETIFTDTFSGMF